MQPHQKSAWDYSTLAKNRNFIWLGPIVQNSKTNTNWQCDLGHVWHTSYNTIRDGHNCPECLGRARKTPEDYHFAANERGYCWIGFMPSSANKSTEWKCSCGTIWKATYSNVKHNGTGCPLCGRKQAANKISLTNTDYRALAKHKGYEWLDDVSVSSKYKATWKCPQGHVFSMAYTNMASQNQGCPFCAKKAKKTAQDYHELALECGHEWIGIVPHNSEAKTEWRCPNGHIWSTSYHTKKKAGGCPECNGRVNGMFVSKPQIAIHKILGGKLNQRVKRYAIDVGLFVDGVNIAIEYDCWYWHSKISAHDKRREQYLLSQGWRIVRIKAGNLIPTLAQLQEAIEYLMIGNVYTEIVLPDWKGS